ncbi:MAG TPA: hypothetical protein VIV40_21130 [Kofleriaceae bacterium]
MQTRLNLVSGCGDRELDALRQTLDDFDNIGGLDDLIAVLHGHARRGTRVDLLDAIGHSRAHGFLVIGTWIIDDSRQTAATFMQLLRPALQQIGVRTIRVLGCKTATPKRGRDALHTIARATRCRVLGTKRFIGNRDYARIGFIAEDALVHVGG